MANLIPVQQLVATNRSHYPNESAEYRAARNALLAEEIELRRHLERVAEQRRALPQGGTIPKDFEFIGPNGPVHLSDLFGGKETLMVYSMMFGPQRSAACPSCTSFLTSWDGAAVNLRERVAMAVTARSPIERVLEFQKQRGLMNLRFLSDTSGDYTRTYVSADDADMPGFSVFTRRENVIRHFYSPEMSFEMSDPGQDPRGAPDMDLLWQMLDYTPEGRGAGWYPKLDYGHK
ncbi:MAG TPA: DUF899 family protein [Acidobacteriaceae bacterium]|nr:DUF899 family protein [Acidobacteriaceae bacterium]